MQSQVDFANTGCLEKKFTQEILNKIRSFLVHPSHFYTSSSQGWEKCLVKVSFKSAYFASFGKALKKC